MIRGRKKGIFGRTSKGKGEKRAHVGQSEVLIGVTEVEGSRVWKRIERSEDLGKYCSNFLFKLVISSPDRSFAGVKGT